jgi:flagellar biosynthesis/type III secretory pathway protein FliH
MGHIVKGSAVAPPRAAAIGTATEAPVLALVAAAQMEARQTAVVLARKMAEKIIGDRASVDPQVMREIAARALAAAKSGPDPVILHVHPDDLESLRDDSGAWLRDTPVQGIVKLLPDPTVERRGCIVETAAGRVDAQLRTQLDALERALRARVNGQA